MMRKAIRATRVTQCYFRLVRCRLAAARFGSAAWCFFMKEDARRASSKHNIRQAYLELAERLEKGSQAGRYAGLDGNTIVDIDYRSIASLDQVRKDLLACSKIRPARLVTIPKRTGGERQVYILSIVDRIRARALFRVLEPLCEKAYSPFLFSYRSGHSSHFASRSIARRYHRNFGNDFVLTVDLKNYSDRLDHIILRNKLRSIGVSDDLLGMIEPFLHISLWQGDHQSVMESGLPQGTPLTSLFANLYLTELDFCIGPRVALYRRVGDDLIIFDKSQEKRDSAYALIKEGVQLLKLTLQENKTHLGKSDEAFRFLGYSFHDNTISLDQSFVVELKNSWRSSFRACSGTLPNRLRRLKKLAFFSETSFHSTFLEVLRQHPHLDDDVQMQRLSHQFYNYATAALFGEATPRNRRRAEPLLREIKFPSLYDYYLAYRRGRGGLAPQAAPGAA